MTVLRAAALLVLAERGLLARRVPAEAALERLVVEMNLHVPVELTLLLEALAAVRVLALERAFASLTSTSLEIFRVSKVEC